MYRISIIQIGKKVKRKPSKHDGFSDFFVRHGAERRRIQKTSKSHEVLEESMLFVLGYPFIVYVIFFACFFFLGII